jgi:hypothetical protein
MSDLIAGYGYDLSKLRKVPQDWSKKWTPSKNSQ